MEGGLVLDSRGMIVMLIFPEETTLSVRACEDSKACKKVTERYE